MANRGGRASSALTRLVIETCGDVCWLQLPGCTRRATTKDHVIPYAAGGDDSLDNLRPACRSCNSKRQDRVVGGSGATVKVVIGPPAAGKTTLIREQAGPADVTIDMDAIARALMPNPLEQTHVYPPGVRHVAIGVRQAAIDRATRLREHCTVWLIHAVPTAEQLASYRALRWQVIVVDPGRDVVELRARTMRPANMMQAVDRWYEFARHNIDPPPGHPDVDERQLVPVSAEHQPSRDW